MEQNKTTEVVRTTLKLEIHALGLQGFSNWISKWNYVRKGGWDFAKVNNQNKDVKKQQNMFKTYNWLKDSRKFSPFGKKAVQAGGEARIHTALG